MLISLQIHFMIIFRELVSITGLKMNSAHILKYIYMYIYIYICMCVCIYIYICVCINDQIMTNNNRDLMRWENMFFRK